MYIYIKPYVYSLKQSDKLNHTFFSKSKHTVKLTASDFNKLILFYLLQCN